MMYAGDDDDLAMAVPDVPGPKPQQDVDLEKGVTRVEHDSQQTKPPTAGQEGEERSGKVGVQHGEAAEGRGLAKTLNLSQVDASTLADFEVSGHAHNWMVCTPLNSASHCCCIDVMHFGALERLAVVLNLH